MTPLQQRSCLRGAVSDNPFLLFLSCGSEAHERTGDGKRLYFTCNLCLGWQAEFFWWFYVEEKSSNVETKAVMPWNY